MSSPTSPGQRYHPGQIDDGRPPNQLQPRIQLNPDERRALQECNRESFWYRCVPLSCMFVGTVQILANKGIITRHPKYGSLFKSFGAGLAGYILGKVSYQKACREKIMRLENSPLADAMRQGKSALELARERTRVDQESGSQATDSFVEVDTYRQNADRRQGEIDSDSNIQHKGLDYETRDMIRFSEPKADDASPPKPSQSYDDLRKRNRSMYEEHNTFPSPSGPYRSPPPSQYSGEGVESRPKYSPPPPPQKKPRRNLYGDIIEE